MFEFRKLASALAIKTRDSKLDKSLDLDIAQASHAIKTLKEIGRDNPALILRALKIACPKTAPMQNAFIKLPRGKKPVAKKPKTKVKPRPTRDFYGTLLSTAYSRR